MEMDPGSKINTRYEVSRKIIEGKLTSLILIKTRRGLPKFIILTPLDMKLNEDENGTGKSEIRIYGPNQISSTNSAAYIWFQPKEGNTIKTRILKAEEIRQAVKQLKQGESACIRFQKEEAILLRGAGFNEEIVMRQVKETKELLST